MVSDLITVSVTAEDLACGWERWISPHPTARDRRACSVCPIEHALARAFGVACAAVPTDGTYCGIQGYVEPIPLPNLGDKIKLIDQGMPVKPFTFQIERPK